MAQTWTLRDIAQAAGRSASFVAEMARSGLLPGYTTNGPRRGAAIPPRLAEAYVRVLRNAASPRHLADLMRTDPKEVLKTAEDLAALARLAVAQSESHGEAA